MKKTILIADDSKEMIKLWKIIFRKHSDYNFIFANDGEQACSLYDQKIDIVIVDFYMPKKNGLEVLNYIKNKNELCKVILTSGVRRQDIEEEIKASKHKFDLLFQKPFNFNEILNLIEKL